MASTLFSPITVGPLQFPNRIGVAPMCQYSAVDGVPQAWHHQHLGSLMASGAGHVVVEATGVAPEGRITPGCTGLWNDAQEATFTALVSELVQVGPGALGIQLAHAGRKASTAVPWKGGASLKADERPWQTVAPSAVPHAEGWHVPTALDGDGMKRLIECFAASARRADRAGFAFAELHAAHAYLLHEFLSPIANRRSDAYGGTLEKRMRFPLEVAAALRAAWPRTKALGARISGSDWAEGGANLDDAVAFARELRGIGYDFLCVSSGAFAESKIVLGPGYQVPFAARIKREVAITTRAVGLIVTPQQAEAVLRDGDADLIALARGMLDDPRWPWRAAEALGDPAPVPLQYARSRPKLWPGAALMREAAEKAG